MSALGRDVLKVHPDDNVLVALRDLRPGTEVAYGGETYALGALAVFEGLIDEGLALTKKMWLTLSDHAKSPWSHPDVVAAEDGRFGDGEFYIRNLAVWSVALALAHHDAQVRRMFKVLVPQMPWTGRTGRRLVERSV